MGPHIPSCDLARRAQEAFSKWHADDAAAGRCIVVRFPTRDLELVFVPVKTKTGMPPVLLC
jgi:hypothetical protein